MVELTDVCELRILFIFNQSYSIKFFLNLLILSTAAGYPAAVNLHFSTNFFFFESITSEISLRLEYSSFFNQVFLFWKHNLFELRDISELRIFFIFQPSFSFLNFLILIELKNQVCWITTLINRLWHIPQVVIFIFNLRDIPQVVIFIFKLTTLINRLRDVPQPVNQGG